MPYEDNNQPEATFDQSEYQLSFTVYPLDEEQAQQLRERLQELILKEIESSGACLYMGPLMVDKIQEAGHEQA